MPDPTTFRTTIEGDTAVVRFSGKLTAEATDTLFSSVEPLLGKHKRMVLDLTGVTEVESRGLGTLVSLFVCGQTSGCKLELRWPPSYAR